MPNQLYIPINNSVVSTLKSHLYILINSLNLFDNRVLHTMIAILRVLYMFYDKDLSLKLTPVLICLTITYCISDVFQYKEENICVDPKM